jgi:hypothetical protein
MAEMLDWQVIDGMLIGGMIVITLVLFVRRI